MGQIVDHVVVFSGSKESCRRGIEAMRGLKEEYAEGIKNSVTGIDEDESDDGTRFFCWSEKSGFREDLQKTLLAATEETEDLSIRVYSNTTDGEAGSWVEEYTNGEVEGLGGWDAAFSSDEMGCLLALQDGPDGDAALAAMLDKSDFEEQEVYYDIARCSVIKDLMLDPDRDGGKNAAALEASANTVSKLAGIYEGEDEDEELSEIASELLAAAQKAGMEAVVKPGKKKSAKKILK